MMIIYFQAPFAAARDFIGGRVRPSLEFVPHSTFYGTILNLAAIESRDENPVITGTRKNLPFCKMAIGCLELPGRASILQQLHSYRIGNDDANKEDLKRTKGTKPNIVPVKRECLIGVKAFACIDGNSDLESRIVDGLAGKLKRYGLPFLGDSNFILDVIKIVPEVEPAFWYEKIDVPVGNMKDHICRLTIAIDRHDSARTCTQLFRRTPKQLEIPPNAWVEMGNQAPLVDKA